jgi:outer membrane protein assembly factor BamA
MDALAGISSRGWTKLGMGITAPEVLSGRLLLEIRAARYDYRSLAWYGPGPDSEKTGRTNYRLEDTTFDALAGWRPGKGLMAGASVGYQTARIGAGEDQRYASADTTYPQFTGPFMDQTDFFRSGGFVQIAGRDRPAGASRGHLYIARFDDYRARSGRPYSFQRLDIELQQYLPVLHPRRGVALRARTIQSFTHGGEQVPFFQQAVLGGGDDLRGFRPFRFQDDNMITATAEYRWEVFSGLDMAVFADAGRVSAKRWDFHSGDLETDVGFGLRFNAHNATFLRVDVGFSHEGFQVFVKFTDVFRQGRLASSSASHIF